jgi:hypothetical protein
LRQWATINATKPKRVVNGGFAMARRSKVSAS